MRTHGWQGDPPASDKDACQRIIAATKRCVERQGLRHTGFSDVAAELGVTRATVYRYFRNIGDLLKATTLTAAGEFLDRLVDQIAPVTDPGEALIEAMAFTIEELPREPFVGVLMEVSADPGVIEDLFSPLSVAFARATLERFPVDWREHGYGPDDMAGLAEYLLRLLHSFLPEPGRPAVPGDPRPFLRRWVLPAFAAQSRPVAGADGRSRAEPV
ncbi:TetR/AcrR family transcriptional regulator [Actinomadura scrupuli]|uniref:TetR/AcrR family transcriptional regulator n=1 Tax=Actinomadura scrupuli TaxID=559629 RepID=UPI003D998501